MRTLLSRLRLVLVAAVLVGGAVLLTAPDVAEAGRGREVASSTETLEPTLPGAESDAVSAASLTEAEYADLNERYLKNRETITARSDGRGADAVAAAGAAAAGEPTETEGDVESDFHAPIGTLQVARNVLNQPALVAPQSRSTLGEPATANSGRFALYTGNTFATSTTDNGATWVQKAFPAAPAAGYVVCCDQDVEYDASRDRYLWSLLWTNAALTHGFVQIAVLPRPDLAPACVYNFNLGADILPDYPHIGLSNDFAYLSTNNIDTQLTAATGDDVWVGAQMRRWSIDSMVDCGAIVIQTITRNVGGQRIFTAVEGATDRMYWGLLQAANTFRLYEWRETAAAAVISDRVVDVTNFVNPDCRGGTNNADWIERSTAFSIAGFRMRGWYGQAPKGGGQHGIGFLWNATPDAAHTQAHIHSVFLDVETKNVVVQPHIFNNALCFGFPDVAPTERGHPAVLLASGGHIGGNAAGVTSAASAGVLLGDDAAGAGPFGPFTTVNAGTHNRTDGRFGDYMTIQQHEPCGYFLTAATYSLNGGTAASNVRQRYIQFGRGRDRPCWNLWAGQP